MKAVQVRATGGRRRLQNVPGWPSENAGKPSLRSEGCRHSAHGS
jgi:hypothetical protein